MKVKIERKIELDTEIKTQNKKENMIEKQTDLLQMPEAEYDLFFKIIDSAVQGLNE